MGNEWKWAGINSPSWLGCKGEVSRWAGKSPVAGQGGLHNNRRVSNLWKADRGGMNSWMNWKSRVRFFFQPQIIGQPHRQFINLWSHTAQGQWWSWLRENSAAPLLGHLSGMTNIALGIMYEKQKRNRNKAVWNRNWMSTVSLGFSNNLIQTK